MGSCAWTAKSLSHTATASRAGGPARSCLVKRSAKIADINRKVSPDVLVALRRARDLTDREFGSPLTLDEMARVANLSKFHFARAFSAAYGETPRAYLGRRRIERAKELLRAANLTVTEICLVVGFESLGSFSSRFRELVGMSPSEYRRRATAGATPQIPGCFVLIWTRPAPATEQGGRSRVPGARASLEP